ncbi:MAG: HNH endonuclease [Nanoarchaeales archaeon]|nr:HNH endonuclease [Nanoarchaeales archaeon]
MISKIESLASPKRLSLNKYRKILLETTDLCFYCEKPLVENQIDVDHFIPWSYIFDLIGTF